jgi:hypothetical protein
MCEPPLVLKERLTRTQKRERAEIVKSLQEICQGMDEDLPNGLPSARKGCLCYIAKVYEGFPGILQVFVNPELVVVSGRNADLRANFQITPQDGLGQSLATKE